MTDSQTQDTSPPPCKRCGGKTVWRGYEPYATPPHQRRKCTCKECGHTFTPKSTVQEQEPPTDQPNTLESEQEDVAGKGNCSSVSNDDK